MTTTPAQRRDAWLRLAQGLERTLAATKVNARASQQMAQAIRDDCPDLDAGYPPEEWEATAWAADQLLQAVLRLPPPEIPEDPEPGQGNLLEALEAEPNVEGGPPVVVTQVTESTVGDNPGDERPDYYWDDQGKQQQRMD